MKNSIQTARVLSCRKIEGGQNEIVWLTDDQEWIAPWPNAPLPRAGDVYRVTNGQAPSPADKIGSADVSISGENSDVLRWRRRDVNGVSRMKVLRNRAIIRRAVRNYMDNEGFIEIESPLLVHGTTPETCIDSFACGDRFLVTSTEYQIKRMEVGGFDKVYSLTQNFRLGDDTSAFRNPEFTMIEWARVGDTLESIESDSEQMAWQAHLALGGDRELVYDGHKINFEPPWQRLSVAEAVEQFVGLSLPDFSLGSIRRAVEKAGIHIKAEWENDHEFLFSLLMDYIQPFLGRNQPVFIQKWPAFQTASALDEPGAAYVKRSELFVAGIEISDGFPSQTNCERQKAAFDKNMAARKKANQPSAEIDTLYLCAMQEGLPSGAGMALGFDRLVMLLTNQKSIKQVLTFAWDEV